MLIMIDGPKFLRRHKLSQKFPSLKSMNGKYGVLMHEAQMNDSRQCYTSLLTASISNFIPGMKGANLANYVEF